MSNTTPRTVWLTSEQRTLLCSCIQDIIKNAEALPWREHLIHIAQESCGFNLQNALMTEGQDITLTRRGLHLPPDSYPLKITEEMVGVIFTWGNLPTSVLQLLQPEPTEFPPTEIPSVPCSRGESCICLS